MQKTHRFTDASNGESKSLLLSHKDQGGLRIRLIVHGRDGILQNFYLTAEEKAEFREALLQESRD